MKRIRKVSVGQQSLFQVEPVVRKPIQVPDIIRDWEHGNYFVYQGELYELKNKRKETTWKGSNPYTKQKVTAKQTECAFIGKTEPILKLYIVLNARVKYLMEKNNKADKIFALFEVENMIKYCKKIILESFQDE